MNDATHGQLAMVVGVLVCNTFSRMVDLREIDPRLERLNMLLVATQSLQTSFKSHSTDRTNEPCHQSKPKSPISTPISTLVWMLI